MKFKIIILSFRSVLDILIENLLSNNVLIVLNHGLYNGCAMSEFGNYRVVTSRTVSNVDCEI